jgi:hypothetical protein
VLSREVLDDSTRLKRERFLFCVRIAGFWPLWDLFADRANVQRDAEGQPLARCSRLPEEELSDLYLGCDALAFLSGTAPPLPSRRSTSRNPSSRRPPARAAQPR